MPPFVQNASLPRRHSPAGPAPDRGWTNHPGPHLQPDDPGPDLVHDAHELVANGVPNRLGVRDHMEITARMLVAVILTMTSPGCSI